MNARITFKHIKDSGCVRAVAHDDDKRLLCASLAQVDNELGRKLAAHQVLTQLVNVYGIEDGIIISHED